MNSLHNKKVLITGANGFIGSHLTEELVKNKAIVYAITRNSDSNIRSLASKITIYNVDLLKYEKVRATVKMIKPDVIYHLAANVNTVRELGNLEICFNQNIRMTTNLINSLNNDYYRFINTGTCEEYGINRAPFKEDQLPMPVSAYSAAKAATTMFCQMLYTSFKLPIVTLRPFLTYGPRQNTKMFIPSLILSAIRGTNFDMTKGEQTREFNYVSDIVDAFIKTATAKRVEGEIINIGNSREIKMKDLARKIVRLCQSKIKLNVGVLPYREGEVMHFYSDSNKARRLLKWCPKITLDEGLKKTIAWYRENYAASS
jgi:nucleoside-diphosphate-sugar epimerase